MQRGQVLGPQLEEAGLLRQGRAHERAERRAHGVAAELLRGRRRGFIAVVGLTAGALAVGGGLGLWVEVEFAIGQQLRQPVQFPCLPSIPLAAM